MIIAGNINFLSRDTASPRIVRTIPRRISRRFLGHQLGLRVAMDLPVYAANNAPYITARLSLGFRNRSVLLLPHSILLTFQQLASRSKDLQMWMVEENQYGMTLQKFLERSLTDETATSLQTLTNSGSRTLHSLFSTASNATVSPFLGLA